MEKSSAVILSPHLQYSLANGNIFHFALGQEAGTYGLERTGQVLWDGTFILSKLLEKSFHHDLQGKKVIELGAGVIGLPGMICSSYGADVILTDLESEISQLQVNIDRNLSLLSKSITAKALDWFKIGDIEYLDMLQDVDIILCADLVFGEEVTYQSLAKAISWLLDNNPKSFVLMSNTDRVQVRKFYKSEYLRDCLFEDLNVSEIIQLLKLSYRQIVWKITKRQ